MVLAGLRWVNSYLFLAEKKESKKNRIIEEKDKSRVLLSFVYYIVQLCKYNTGKDLPRRVIPWFFDKKRKKTLSNLTQDNGSVPVSFPFWFFSTQCQQVGALLVTCKRSNFPWKQCGLYGRLPVWTERWPSWIKRGGVEVIPCHISC